MDSQNLCSVVMMLLMLVAIPSMLATDDVLCPVFQQTEPPLSCEGEFNIYCSCGDHHVLDDYSVQAKKFKTVKFECRPEGRWMRELQNGSWVEKLPKCLKRCPADPKSPDPLSCSVPHDMPKHGYIPWEKANCNCYPTNKYYLDGDRSLLCIDGNWVGQLPRPKCKKPCPPIGTAKHSCSSRATNTIRGYKHGDKATCYCNPREYVTDGPEGFQCGTDGHWIPPELPKCIKFCTETKAPLHCNRFSVKPGDIASCRCAEPYVLEDPEANFECRNDGRWMKQLPDGTWIEELPKCINKTTTTTTTTTTSSTKTIAIETGAENTGPPPTDYDGTNGENVPHVSMVTIIVAMLWMVMICCGIGGWWSHS